MMSSSRGAYRFFAANGGGGWATNATSVSANLLSSSPGLEDSFVRISDDCHGYRDVTDFTSAEGVSPITLETSLQTGTAVYNVDRYVFSGLQFGPAFAGSSDTLTMSFDDGAGTTLSESIDPPPQPTDVNDHLGEPAGLGTLFRAPDGGFDLMYTFVNLSGSSAFAGVSCEFPASDMTLAGAMREHAFVDDATVAWIASEGLTASDVYVAYMTTTNAPGFFERDITLQAGQMFSVSAADL